MYPEHSYIFTSNVQQETFFLIFFALKVLFAQTESSKLPLNTMSGLGRMIWYFVLCINYEFLIVISILYQAKGREKLNPHKATSLDAVRYFASKWEANGNPYEIHQKIAESCLICSECLEVTLKVYLMYEWKIAYRISLKCSVKLMKELELALHLT